MLTFKKEKFTPQRAQVELDRARAAGIPQRDLAAARIEMYQGAMARGGWEADTGEVVKFSKINGHGWVMIDGQNRMTAIIAANTDVELWSCYGVDQQVFALLDQGMPRSVTHLLTIAKWPNASVCATAGRMLWKEDSTGSPFEKPGGVDALTDGGIAMSIQASYKPALLDHVVRHKAQLSLAERRRVGGKGWLAYIGMRIAEIDPAAWPPILTWLADPTTPAPHSAWVWAVEYLRDVRREYEAESAAGRVLMGRNKDLCDETVRAYRAAWEFQRTGRRCTSKTAIKNAAKNYVNAWVPFA